MRIQWNFEVHFWSLPSRTLHRGATSLCQCMVLKYCVKKHLFSNAESNLDTVSLYVVQMSISVTLFAKTQISSFWACTIMQCGHAQFWCQVFSRPPRLIRLLSDIYVLTALLESLFVTRFSVRPGPFHLRAPTWSKPYSDNLPTGMNMQKNRSCAYTYLSDYVHFVFQKTSVNICFCRIMRISFLKRQPLAFDFVRLCACRFPNFQPLAFELVGLCACRFPNFQPLTFEFLRLCACRSPKFQPLTLKIVGLCVFHIPKFQPLTLDLHTVQDPNGKDLAHRKHNT